MLLGLLVLTLLVFRVLWGLVGGRWSRFTSFVRLPGTLWRYLLIRFLLIFPTVFILVTMVFVLMRITGDPITVALGGKR